MTPLLERVGKDTKYSQMVEDQRFVSDFGGVENLSTEVFNLLAKGYLEIKTVHDEDEGDDFILNVTILGKKKIERSKNTGQKI